MGKGNNFRTKSGKEFQLKGHVSSMSKDDIARAKTFAEKHDASVVEATTHGSGGWNEEPTTFTKG